MTIYNINLGLGWASSGVEYAQAYRAGILRTIEEPAHFIFTDMILGDNLQHVAENIGFRDEEVIWLYNHFTDIKIAPTTVTLEQVLAEQLGEPIRTERSGKIARFFYEGDRFITCYLRFEDQDIVEHVEHVFAGNLIRKDFYSYTKYCSEFFVPQDNIAQLYQRTFYNEDGSIAYDILMRDGQEVMYRLGSQVFYGKPAFLRHFMKSLNLTKQDLVILDRETGVGQVVFEEAQAAHLGVVVHAEHFSKNAMDEDYILWNNYYDYQFTNADKVDFFLVSTDRQNQVLAEQFANYTKHRPRIVTIPVGSLDELTYPDQARKPFSLMTASRLAPEKHIDWLILGVVEAHKTLPDLTFDIYGSGGEETKLRELIAKHGAQDYIRLMGHADLAQIYRQYEVYLTASTSEGFGLTLLEAIGSGLPLIGLDVPYGNQTFIIDGENGYLLPDRDHYVETELQVAYAEKICQLYQGQHLPAMEATSYQLADRFLTSRVEEAWKQLIKEVQG